MLRLNSRKFVSGHMNRIELRLLRLLESGRHATANSRDRVRRHERPSEYDYFEYSPYDVMYCCCLELIVAFATAGCLSIAGLWMQLHLRIHAYMVCAVWMQAISEPTPLMLRAPGQQQRNELRALLKYSDTSA